MSGRAARASRVRKRLKRERDAWKIRNFTRFYGTSGAELLVRLRNARKSAQDTPAGVDTQDVVLELERHGAAPPRGAMTVLDFIREAVALETREYNLFGPYTSGAAAPPKVSDLYAHLDEVDVSLSEALALGADHRDPEHERRVLVDIRAVADPLDQALDEAIEVLEGRLPAERAPARHAKRSRR